MLALSPYVVIPIYVTCIVLSILIFRVVDWNKIISESHRSTTMARLLYLFVALAVGAIIGTMFVIIAGLPYG